MATTAFSFDLNKEFDPNWEEDSAQRIFSGMTDQEKKPIDQTVVETGVKSLQPERSYTPAKEGEGRLTSDMTGNPLDDFEAPLKQEAPVVESEEPDEPSIGRIISDGYNYISQVKMVQSGRTGRNSREVAREKALDNQAIFQAYSAMQDRLSERGYDRGLVDVLGTHNGGGLRSAEDIDRLFKIKQEGITFQTEDGRTARLDPDAPWETIMEADRKTRGVKIEGAASDSLKTAQEELGLIKSYQEISAKSQESPQDQTAQVTLKAAEGAMETAFGERWGQIKFGLNQGIFANAVKFGDQKVDLSGNPVQGVEAKTASQAAADMVATGMIPVVDFTLDSEGEAAYDENSLNAQFPGGKPIEGSYVAFRNPNDGSFGPYKILKGIPTKLPSTSTETSVKEKPAPAEGNPFRAKAEESQIAQGTQDLEDRFYKIQDEMTKLDQSRTRLIDQRNQTEKPFPSLQGFPGAISAEKAADTYDEITAKMRELAKEKSELLEKRRAIKNKK
jgi:hypothetical protein